MYFDTHTHTKHSCDSKKEPEDAIIHAIKNGLSGIAITDHSDLRLFEPYNIPTELPASGRDADALAEKYKEQIKVFSGIEISDAAIPKYRDRLNKAFDFYDYDILLASAHIVDLDGRECEFSSTDFSKFDISTLERLLDIYFEYLLITVYENNFSTLCHLTYPLRYINGIYKKGITIDRNIKRIEEIYKVIIDKNTALEINTAKCTAENPFAFCPEKELLELYIALGGKMFTLGSDSHIASSEGRCFKEAAEFLKEHGIGGCYYFKKKNPVYYEI